MVYYLYILICILGNIFDNKKNPNFHKHWERNFAVLMGSIIFILGALRHKYVGIDTPSYVDIFIPNAINHNCDQLIENSRDPFFYIFIKIIYYLVNDIQLIFAVIALLYAFFVSKTLHKYSKNLVVSFIILLTFRYFPYSMTGLRQGLAFAIVFYSTRFIFEKKVLPFILTIAIASLAHKSAIFLLPLYFIQFINLKWYSFLIIFLTLAATYVFKDSLTFILSVLPNSSQYELYINKKNKIDYGYLYYYLYIAVFIAINFLLLYTDTSKLKKSKLSFYYIAFAIGIFFQTIAMQNDIFMRIGMYFAYYSVLLIPEAISASNFKKKIIINFLLILFLVILFILAGPGAGVDNYYFFWQKDITKPL